MCYFQQQKRKNRRRNMRKLLLVILFCQLAHGQIDSVVVAGQRLINENNDAKAIAYFNKHLKKPKNTVQKVHLLLGLAEIYKLNLDYNTANTYYIQISEILKNTENSQLKFLYYVKMAEFYRKRGFYTQAIEKLDKANMLLKIQVIDDQNLANYYSRKAAIFTEYYSIADSTLFYAEKALAYATKAKDLNTAFYSKMEIACVYERQNQFKRTITEFEGLISYAKMNNLVQNEADVYINYINVLIKDKQIQKALEEAIVALDFARKQQLLYNENMLTIKIYEIYKSLENYEEANKYLELRLELAERYEKLEHNKFLFELEEKYRLAEKESQLKINALELLNKDKLLSSNQMRFYITFLFFIIAVLITILIAYFLKRTNRTNKKLQFLSQQNEFLLSEANHRINNNLQLIIILITGQLSKLPENETVAIKSILDKINSIAVLHRHLYQSDDKSKVNSYKYLNDICSSFTDLFTENNIECQFEVDEFELQADVAMYIGLLFTELCVNSMKHAFHNQELKNIHFKLACDGEVFHFNYSDNGLTDKNNMHQPKLMTQLCRQLKVTYHLNVENGFSISFEKELN